MHERANLVGSLYNSTVSWPQGEATREAKTRQKARQESQQIMLTQRSKHCLSVMCFVWLAGIASLAAQGAKPPRPVYAPAADYPPSALRDGVRGAVLLHLTVPTEGVPKDITIVKGVRPDIDQKAIETVSKWKFAPATKDDDPISVSITLKVTFNLVR